MKKTIMKGLFLSTTLMLIHTPFTQKVHASQVHSKELATALYKQDGLTSTYNSKTNVTKPVKECIKLILEHKGQFFDVVEKYAGKKIRTTIETEFNQHIEPVLKKLLGYTILTWDTVNSKVYSSLRDAGYSENSAKTLAYFTTLAMKNF
ncbi:hypothetical protein LI071_11110 [Bacillus subtilis]|uniref:hypothetical protein n=1 Tax=Bacillus subtilis TaxID=1423 RepID=UPI001D088AE5|nr:hypothetical protein [Bacillus subtilis]MCB7161221.1 hypothetical protein [Bacillus subtilis]MCB7457781.1 hypothetical protein [Bacillus subtilis]